MQVHTSYLLTDLNTLKLKSSAKYFVQLRDVHALAQIADVTLKKHCPFFVLGGGSNLILPEEYPGLAIHNNLLGIQLLSNANFNESNNNCVLVKAQAGENWDHFVAYCLEHGWYGLENLSLIPGTVGAAPIQNIGAYGVEAKDFIQSVEVYDVIKRQMYTIQNKECDFSYRNSRFKTEPHLVVLAVTFCLLTQANLNLQYGDVAKQLENIDNPSALDLRTCIIKIRQGKLPDPNAIANVGSFFHNPILKNTEVARLQESYPNVPVYHVDEHNSKVSAGWLIDNLGLKGYRLGNVGVYAKQALVLVNYGDATKSEILTFAQIIQEKVQMQYGIQLNIEPIIL